jgi:hypothetical protein
MGENKPGTVFVFCVNPNFTAETLDNQLADGQA